MVIFIEIIESDGHEIGAGDDLGVAAAELEERSTLAT